MSNYRGFGDVQTLRARLLIGLSQIVRIFPEGSARVFAAGAGLLASRIWRRERNRLAETIDRVYHKLGKSFPIPLEKMIDHVFIHFSLNLLEIMNYPKLSKSDFAARFEFEGMNHLHEALAKGKGVILAVPHIGNWEMLGAAIAARGFPLHSFYLSQKEDVFGVVLDYFRSYSGIILHDRDRAAVGGLRALKNGEILGMISDQDGGNQGVYTDFLGHWVSMPAGPANWSLKTGAVVIPLYSLRIGRSARFISRFLPPLPDEPSASRDEMLVSRTLRLIRWMEEIILAHPDQYLWFYDRFKPRHEKYIAKLKASGYRMRHGEACYGIPDAGNEPTK